MTSFRRLISSRANAALSTGPRTDAGKRRSSRNAVRHGLLGKRPPEEEFPEEYAALLRTLHANFQPRTPEQHALVATVARTQLQQHRLLETEMNLLQQTLDAQRPTSPSHPLLAADWSLLDNPHFRVLPRYDSILSNRMQNALDRLYAARSISPRRSNG